MATNSEALGVAMDSGVKSWIDKTDVFRPEGPILSAQAEGLGCIAVGNVGPERAIQQRLIFSRDVAVIVG
jgi:hypothetical protein